MRAPIWLALLCLAACTPREDVIPLPTKTHTIDRVQQGLDAAAADAERQRAEIDRATR